MSVWDVEDAVPYSSIQVVVRYVCGADNIRPYKNTIVRGYRLAV